MISTDGRSSLTRYAWLSIAAAVATIGLKAGAYRFTGSVGLLSDALESGVNLVGALMALAMLTLAARPPDESHTYGHSKAEYFSSGVEGGLIVIAAFSIFLTAIPRLGQPRPIENPGPGLAISVAASVINLGVALVLLRAGKRNQSISLEANARHLLTDVWTSVGVVAGVGLVVVTGWARLDPVVAFVVAGNIVYSGIGILRRSMLGLMDTAVPADELRALQQVLDRYSGPAVEFHALRTRQSAARRFMSVHVLVPGAWTVHDGHALLEMIEADLRQAVPGITVFTHLESRDDPASYLDMELDRRSGAEGQARDSRPSVPGDTPPEAPGFG